MSPRVAFFRLDPSIHPSPREIENPSGKDNVEHMAPTTFGFFAWEAS